MEAWMGKQNIWSEECIEGYINIWYDRRDFKIIDPFLIQKDIGGHPPFPTGSKQFSDILAIYYF
jgi:hypothetical protein